MRAAIFSIEECKAYAVQLRDKNRANTAEHAAEAIEYLLSALQQSVPHAVNAAQRTWVDLTDEDIALIDWESLTTKKDCVRAIEVKLKERNA